MFGAVYPEANRKTMLKLQHLEERFFVALTRLFCVGVLLFLSVLFICDDRALGMGSRPERYVVGMRSLAVVTPDHSSLGVVVWYPAQRTGKQPRSRMGMWTVQAEQGATPARLVSPVIVISHDMMDMWLSCHELASALASAGFIVVVPLHTGDNAESASAVFSAASLYYRPLQVHEALDALLKEPAFKGLVDTQRIGLLGSGLGALTALQLCGVDLNYEAHQSYCAKVADQDALCGRWPLSRMYRLYADIDAIREKYGDKAFVAPLPHVKAVGLLSPGWMSFADRGGVSSLRVPLAVLFAGQGGFYAPVLSGEDVLEMLPRPLYDSVNYQILPNVDHYSFSSECPPEVLADSPESCGRLAGAAREKVREIRDDYFVSFFQAALGVPIPVLPPVNR